MKQRLILLFALCLGTAHGQQVSPPAQDPHAYLNPPGGAHYQTPAPAATPTSSNLSAILLQCDGAIRILEAGIRNNWPIERYFAIFDESPTLDKTKAPESSRQLVRTMLTPLTRPHTIWDERPPTNTQVEVLRVLGYLRSQRELLRQRQAMPMKSQ